jgi:SAM-dependent methyltransferase
MGLGGAFLADLIELKRGGYLTEATKVVEIGAQQLADSFLISDSLLDEVFALFGRSRPDFGKPHGSFQMAEDAPSSRLFWSALGLDYTALDFDGHRDSIAIDLNRDSVTEPFAGAFDLVVNTGTTEHVANQDNAFRVIHDLTRKGGVTYHEVPAGMSDHGLINYNPRFFWKVRDANDYEVLCMKVCASEEEPIPPHVQENNELYGGGEKLGISHLNPIAIRVSFRKRNRQPFASPLDLPDELMPGRLNKLATVAKRAIPWR